MPWNPSDKHANITLSNSDKSAETSTNVSASVRSVEFKNTGKWYFEVYIDAHGFESIGIMKSTVSLDGYVGEFDDAWGYTSSGPRYHDGSSTFGFNGFSYVGAIVGVAIDIDSNRIWFARDGVWQSGDPASGTTPAFEDATITGDLYAAATVKSSSLSKVTIRQSVSDCTYTPPSGFDYFAEDPPQEQFSDGGSAGASGEAQNLTGRETDGATAGASGDAENLTFRGNDGGIAGASGAIENFTRRLSDGGSAGASAGINSIFNRAITPDGGAAGASGLANITAARSLSDGAAAGASGSILNYTEFKASYLAYAVERFYITLTGSADSVSDIDIPISNFNARFQTGNPTYLTVTIPNFSGYATAVAARPNGEIILTAYYEWLGDTLLTQEILRVDLQNINTFEGAESKSIVLDGYKTQSPVGQTVELDYLQYREVQGGTTTLRFPRIDFFLRPGDTLTAGSTTITVGAIQYTVTADSRSMSVSE